jgi:DNA-binding MarR family transcriptional regulator
MIGQESATELFSSLTALLRTSRAQGQRSREMGATGTGLGVLKTLQQGDARPGDLAVSLQVVPSVISRAVAPLEQAGLVERKTDPADARASLLGLTDLGRQRLRQVQEVYVEQLRQAFGSWTDEEAEQAAAVLLRLEQSLSSYSTPESHQQQLSEAMLASAGDSTPILV